MNNVVFKTEPSEKGVHIPNSMLKLSGLDGLPLEAHTLKGATVIISGEMEAMELIQTVDSLQKLYRKLLDHLIVASAVTATMVRAPLMIAPTSSSSESPV